MIQRYEIRVYRCICDNCGKVEFSQVNRTLWKAAKWHDNQRIYAWNVPEMKVPQFGRFVPEGELVHPYNWFTVEIPESYGQIRALYCSQECMKAVECVRHENRLCAKHGGCPKVHDEILGWICERCEDEEEVERESLFLKPIEEEKNNVT